MKTNDPNDFHDDDTDAVWRMVNRGSRTQPSAQFVNNVVRTARLTKVETPPWWSRFGLSLSWGGLATAGTAAVLAIAGWVALKPAEVVTPAPVAVVAPAESGLASLDEIAQTELLVDASENPADFSDSELLAIMGL